MFLLRPRLWLSGKTLAQELGFTVKTKKSIERGWAPDIDRDFISMWDFPGAPEDLRHFYARNKKGQRDLIKESGVKTPDDYEPYEGKYVHRPVRHRASQGYTVLSYHQTQPGYYSSPVFPKEQEFRLIFVKGNLTLVMNKRVPTGSNVEEPWGGGLSSFSTMRRTTPRLITQTNILDDLSRNGIIQQAHIVAVDVMYNQTIGYAVCEFNFAPALSIQANITEIKNGFLL